MIEGKNNILWLASYPKSGNTWFRVFLSNLFSDSNDAVNINQLNRIPIASSRVLIDNYLGINSSDLTPTEIENFRPEVYKLISYENDRDFLLKTHDAWHVNPNGQPIFPIEVTKGVIYLIRNPLDVVVSFAFHNNASIDKTISNLNDPRFGLSQNNIKLFYQIPQHISSWSDHVISWIFHSRLPVHIIRYEDMLEEPNDTFKKALDFMNVKALDAEINQSIKNSSFKNLSMQEKKYGFNEKNIDSERFFRSGKKNNWKNYLLKQQVDQIVKHHHTIMEEFGYLAEIN